MMPSRPTNGSDCVYESLFHLVPHHRGVSVRAPCSHNEKYDLQSSEIWFYSTFILKMFPMTGPPHVGLCSEEFQYGREGKGPQLAPSLIIGRFIGPDFSARKRANTNVVDLNLKTMDSSPS